MNNTRGILIAFEGIDGAGKTTQAARLVHALKTVGEPVVSSKEPTDGPWGQRIRESAQTQRMSLDDELAAFINDRREHVRELINPALKEGKIVVLDRYFYSTVAYQGARGASAGSIMQMMRNEFPVPDATYLIDVEPVLGLHRVESVRGDRPNEFEKQGALEKSSAIFDSMSGLHPEIVRIDGNARVENVWSAVFDHFCKFPLKAKRCAKSYDCDVFHCGPREAGECEWSNLIAKLARAKINTAV
jgi:dTMP kinase